MDSNHAAIPGEIARPNRIEAIFGATPAAVNAIAAWLDACPVELTDEQRAYWHNRLCPT